MSDRRHRILNMSLQFGHPMSWHPVMASRAARVSQAYGRKAAF